MNIEPQIFNIPALPGFINRIDDLLDEFAIAHQKEEFEIFPSSVSRILNEGGGNTEFSSYEEKMEFLKKEVRSYYVDKFFNIQYRCDYETPENKILAGDVKSWELSKLWEKFEQFIQTTSDFETFIVSLQLSVPDEDIVTCKVTKDIPLQVYL